MSDADIVFEIVELLKLAKFRVKVLEEVAAEFCLNCGVKRDRAIEPCYCERD